MKNILFALLFLLSSLAFSQQSFSKKDIKVAPLLEGTIYLPTEIKNPPLAIIIAGSGPTDRDGNQPMMKNNSLKYLATALANKGIATFGYDKRSVALIKNNQFSETEISFDDFISDAQTVYDFFERADEFSKIILIGHSQGSLIALEVAQNNSIDGVVSIAGAGQTIDKVIVAQLAKQSPALKENAQQAFEDIKNNGESTDYSPLLASVFRKDIQPFIANWMQYNPQVIIESLNMPVLILNGTRDIQVHEDEAKLLKEAQPNAKLVIIEDMNHILKSVPENLLENQKSYNNPSLPIVPQLVEEIVTFIIN